MQKTGISEELIAHVWENRLLRSELKTTDATPLTILSAGERQRSGPDFRDAEILIGTSRVSGDVELHVNASDWYLHDHHIDPKYNGVILHVFLQDDGVSLLTRKQNGDRVAGLELADALVSPLEKIISEYHRDKGVSSCLIVKEKPEAISRVLSDLGWERIIEKADRLEETARREGLDQAIFVSLMDALGFSANRSPFVRLATIERYSILSRLPRDVIEARLFARSGLLPRDSTRLDDETVEYIAGLSAALSGEIDRLDCMDESEWRFGGVRPSNYPTRRIAAAAELVARFSDGILAEFLAILGGNNESEHAEKTFRRMRDLLVIESDGYWATHSGFGRGIHPDHTKLIGTDRAAAIIVNVILPAVYLWAARTNNPRLIERISCVYRSIPCLQENRITRKFTMNLGIKLETAAQQQGAIFLHRVFCSIDACDICPVAYGNI